MTFLVVPPKDGLAPKYICTSLTSLFWEVDVIFKFSNVVWELVNIDEYHLVLLKHIHILLTSLFLTKKVIFKPSNVVGTLWTSMNTTWVKTKWKEPPKWSMDTFKNCIFVCLKDHKWPIIIWIVIILFEIFSINYKVYILKVWHKSKIFLHVQSTQISRMDSFLFSTKCAPLFLKIGKDFNIDD